MNGDAIDADAGRVLGEEVSAVFFFKQDTVESDKRKKRPDMRIIWKREPAVFICTVIGERGTIGVRVEARREAPKIDKRKHRGIV